MTNREAVNIANGLRYVRPVSHDNTADVSYSRGWEVGRQVQWEAVIDVLLAYFMDTIPGFDEAGFLAFMNRSSNATDIVSDQLYLTGQQKSALQDAWEKINEIRRNGK